MMKKWMKPISSMVIASALIVGSAGVAPSLGLVSTVEAAEQSSVRNVIQVVGKGEISVKPDIAYLSIGVNTEADTAQKAQKDNAAKIQKLNNLLKNTWKIADKDIQSTQFYVEPNYTYSDKDGRKVKGYIAHHTLMVTYRDLSNIGKLLDDASAAGANNIQNIRFSVENPDQYEALVIEKAMANADLKAGAIAQASKRSLGMVLNVTQGNYSDPIVYAQAEMMKLATSADSAASTSIESGEVKVTTELSVQYEMK